LFQHRRLPDHDEFVPHSRVRIRQTDVRSISKDRDRARPTFFDFCSSKAAPKAGDLLQHLRARDWTNFAKFYNGMGQVPVYSAKLKAAYEAATPLLKAPKAA
jgi:hypothetical protein